jgi:ribose transport system permease protein
VSTSKGVGAGEASDLQSNPELQSGGWLAEIWNRIRPATSGQLWRNAGLIAALVALGLLLAIQRPYFFSRDNFEVLATQMVTLGIASVGMALLIISGNVDLSIGSIFALAGTVAALFSFQVDPLLAFSLGIIVGGIFGFINGVLVWRIRISPLIITLGTLSLFLGLALVLTQGVGIPNLPRRYSYFGQNDFLGLPIPVWCLLVVVVVGHIVLSRTTIGRHIYAIGGNRQAAEIAGIRVRRMVIGLFLVNGALIGFSAALATSRFDAADVQFGNGLGLDAITAVILGGVAFTGGEGSIFGVMLAVVLLTVINASFVALGIDPYLDNVAKGGALLVAVGLDQLTHEQRERVRTILALRELKQRHQQADEDSAEVPDTVETKSG